MPSAERQTPSCPRCGAVEPSWMLCSHCLGQLMRSLRMILPGRHADEPGALPWERSRSEWAGLDQELVVSLARQGRRGAGNGGRSSDVPLPLDMGAASARFELRNTLSTWARVLNLNEPGPENTLTSMAEWLIARKERIRGHEASNEIANDIIGAVSHARWVIDSPASQQFVSKCEVCGKGDVYASPSSDIGVCRACDHVITGVQRRRGALLDRVEDRLATKGEILKALPAMYGKSVTDTRFRKWVQRGRLVATACEVETRSVQFRIGDVLDLTNSDAVKAQHAAS